MEVMKRSSHPALTVVGVVSILTGVAGLAYSATTFFRDYAQSAGPETPYFYACFYLMSGICIMCCAGLVYAGKRFLRGDSEPIKWFIGLLVFEVCFFFAIGTAWASGVIWPEFAMSVAAATGIATGGLSFQFAVLFPLWGPFVAYWGYKRSGGARIEPALAAERVHARR